MNFDRKMLGQRGLARPAYARSPCHSTAGAGHHSPIGAYDQKSDRALVMDVARRGSQTLLFEVSENRCAFFPSGTCRYKYPPFWAGLTDVFLAMNSTAARRS